MPLDVKPPRGSRFGSPLILSRVHWVRPELLAEVTYLEWTDDGLLRQVVYQGLRGDKPALEVRRDRPQCGDLTSLLSALPAFLFSQLCGLVDGFIAGDCS